MKPTPKKIGLWTLIIGVVVQTIIFIAIVITWRCRRNYDKVGSSICTPCTDLWSRRDGLIENKKKLVGTMRRSEDNSTCCGGSELVLKLAMRKITIDLYFDQTKNVPVPSKYELCDTHQDTAPHARLTGIVSTSPKQDSHRLHWTKDGDTFTTNGATHLEDDGEIFIWKPGNYLISTSLHLMTNSNKTGTVDYGGSASTTNPTADNDSYYVFSQFLYLTSPQTTGKTTVISERRHDLPCGYKEGICFPSVLKAVYRFEEFDRVSVAVSHPQLVVLGDVNSTFTAFYTHG
ncbi:uncharacterized protein LOC127834949 [Dreissena polymorpha]|uniref:THD domain-containing protein n=1 Tax=Dreissena polymorpha TaxID=45954 RepID=A0A9D4FV42_DREPO|nr:uncharacterized protein LOC127834949 [Dreissena polymorpha]KAH3805092.1 hypothetical protein DPMN_133388 [Dreissena polymorpha]